jgi:signal transduction histidine kinase
LPGRFDAFRAATRHLRLRRSQGLPGRVLESGRVEWSDAIAEDLVERRAQLGEDLGIATAIAIPVTLQGETVGVLEFFSGRSIRWDDQMVNVGRSVGAQLGRVVERKHLERMLANQTAQQQREIARQIHDTVSQQISGVAIMSETLRQDLADIGSPLAEQAGKLVDYLKEGQEQLRKITRGLMPVEVDSDGLMKALEDLADATQAMHGLDCQFECERPVAVHDNATATNLFHIVQEAVHNAIKHAGAEHILIQMKLERDHLRLLVRDDGVGMSSVSRQVGGMGMRIMRHRTGVIGADLDIVSQPGGGTSVFCYLTLEDVKQEE